MIVERDRRYGRPRKTSDSSRSRTLTFLVTAIAAVVRRPSTYDAFRAARLWGPRPSAAALVVQESTLARLVPSDLGCQGTQAATTFRLDARVYVNARKIQRPRQALLWYLRPTVRFAHTSSHGE